MQPLTSSDAPQSPPLGTTLEYSQPNTASTRPGIIVAIGVTSIIVACLSGLANLSGVLSAVAMSMARMPPPAVTTPAAATPAPPATPAAPAPPAPPAAPPPAPAPAPAAGAIATTTFSVTTYSGTTVTTAGGPAAAAVFGGFDTTPVILSLVTSAFGVALAVLLFVAGILMLRASRYAATLHWWYVLMKIPLVIAATAVSVWMWSGAMKVILASTPGAAGAGPLPWWMMHLSTFIGALLALAYPLALIFVLRSRRVRDYFDAVHA